MAEPRLNVDYWLSRYGSYEEDNDLYEEALALESTADKARELWTWKDLSRRLPFEDVEGAVREIDFDRYLDQDQGVAVRGVSEELEQRDVISGNSLVTPAFLLHLAASEPGDSSAKFPIYDRRVWNAYAYLSGLREAGDRLYAAASSSPRQYEEFCEEFRSRCPDRNPREYEQALFMFGGYIWALSPGQERTPISEIDRVLSNQEKTLRDSIENGGFALADTNLE